MVRDGDEMFLNIMAAHGSPEHTMCPCVALWVRGQHEAMWGLWSACMPSPSVQLHRSFNLPLLPDPPKTSIAP